MSQNRLFLINSHLVSRFPKLERNTDLEEFRKREPEINSGVFREHYFGVFEKDYSRYMNLMSDQKFNHYQEFEMERQTQRGETLKKLLKVYFSDEFSPEIDKQHPLKKASILYSLSEYDVGLGTRLIVHFVLYLDTIHNLGTEKHQHLLERGYKLQDFGCFAMTELGHGSNVAKFETKATYDNSTREFVLNSPTATSAKWWIGAAAKTANKAIVFAQLVVNEQEKGIHAFVVDIRNKETHEVLEGVTIGDCGKKAGLDNIDNGFILFTNYRVPYNSLLDSLSFVAADGKFKSSIKDKDKRLGSMLSGLVRGRLSVVNGTEGTMKQALCIALRFSAARKQFGPSDGPECSILEYQLQKFRLMPNLAKCFALRAISTWLWNTYKEQREVFAEDPECEELKEFHAVLCAIKAIASWYGVKTTQDCREACGGLGYSAYSSLDRLRSAQDIQVTWEGDNSVLIQQTSRFILKQVQRTFKGQRITASSLEFLKMDVDEVKKFRAEFESEEELKKEDLLLQLLEHRVNMYLHSTVTKLQSNAGNSSDMQQAWNKTQVFHIQELAKSFGELLIAKEFCKFANELLQKDQTTGQAFKDFFYIYAIEILQKDIGVFLEAAFSKNQIKVVKDCLVSLCESAEVTSLKLVEAVSPPDSVLGSAIGASDGQIYQHLIDSAESAPGVYSTPSWTNLLKSIN